ncbi:hypothetical protein D3C80_1479530 [compost metagenome]
MDKQIVLTGGFGLEEKIMDGRKAFRLKMTRQIVKFWSIWQKKEFRYQKEFLERDVI